MKYFLASFSCLLILVHFVICDKRAGYVEKIEEVSNQPCTMSEGIPRWLDGYFVRQVGGALGPFYNPVGSHITHLFDVMGMVATYHFKNGQVWFSNKFYDSKQYNIWNEAGRNMTKSKVAWDATYTDWDPDAFAANQGKFNDKSQDNPNVCFWRMGTKVQAVSETSAGFYFDVPTLTMYSDFPFTDDNFGMPKNYIQLNVPAHEHVDSNDFVWSTILMLEPTSQTVFNMHHVIFTINPHTWERKAVGDHISSKIDLRKCVMKDGKLVYSDTVYNEGYIHSFAMTDNYVILPISNYIFNPCMLANQDHSKPYPFFKSWFNYDSSKPARFIVFKKSPNSAEYQQTINVKPGIFVTHQFNAWEDDDNVNIDMLIYRTADIYSEYVKIDLLMDNNLEFPATTYPMRYTINLSSGYYWSKFLINKAVDSAEFSTINYNYYGKKYKYGYMLRNPYADKSNIVKINFETKAELTFQPELDVYLQEPVFVQTPGTTGEDEGIILVGGFYGNRKKGLFSFHMPTSHFLGLTIVIDAKTMTELGRVEAPILTPFGIHNRYYSRADLGLDREEKSMHD